MNDLNYDVTCRCLTLNIFGTLFMTKVFLPHLRSQPEAYIVNMARMGWFLPLRGQTNYRVAKEL